MMVFCLFQGFEEKEYQMETKRNETFGDVIFGRKHTLWIVARCTKWHPDGGLGNPAHIVWGRERHPGRISLRMEPE